MHGIPIVNPDSVRLAIHGQRFCLQAEQFVWATVNAMIRSLFLAGHDQVILDATNIKRKLRDTISFNGCKVAFYHVDTHVNICRERSRDDAEILPVIERMVVEFEPLGDDELRFVPTTLLTFDDALCIAKGCFDYGGGYRAQDGLLEVFHHGIQTVINSLEGANKTGMADLQSKVLHRIGSGQEVGFPPTLEEVVNS